MKRVYKILVVAIIIVVLITIYTVVNAASFNLNINTNKSQVYVGEQIELIISVGNVDMGASGINTVQGILEYDTDIFEEITLSGVNNWSISYNDETDNSLYGTFLIYKMSSGTDTTETIGKITLKVKDGVTPQTTNIVFKDIASNDGTQLIMVADKTVPITIASNANNNTGNNNGSTGENENPGNNNGSTGENENPGNNNGSTGENENPGNNNGSTGENKNTGNNNGSTGENSNTDNNNNSNGNNTANSGLASSGSGDNSVSNENIVYAGASDSIYPISAVLFVISIISFIKYKQLKAI